ncbi:hypothetical protein Acsp04_47900 [Actinomadura sp. NBRC 104425]|nr:hypothetical protein Acsp04_47900 [Actinomadura sp. NBRC 104425]
MSSIRSTSVPPDCLAITQLNSAERAPPTWNMPVGDGAKRTRIEEAEDMPPSLVGPRRGADSATPRTARGRAVAECGPPGTIGT